MQENEHYITTEIRVLGQTIKPFHYPAPIKNEHCNVATNYTVGEVLVVKAEGTWGEHKWPVSLHITVPPGCGTIPHTGDNIKVTVERI